MEAVFSIYVSGIFVSIFFRLVILYPKILKQHNNYYWYKILHDNLLSIGLFYTLPKSKFQCQGLTGMPEKIREEMTYDFQEEINYSVFLGFIQRWPYFLLSWLDLFVMFTGVGNDGFWKGAYGHYVDEVNFLDMFLGGRRSFWFIQNKTLSQEQEISFCRLVKDKNLSKDDCLRNAAILFNASPETITNLKYSKD